MVSSYPSRRPASPAAPFLSPISPPTATAPFFYAAPTQLPHVGRRHPLTAAGSPPGTLQAVGAARSLRALPSPTNARQAHRHSGQPAPSPRSPMPSRRRTAWRAPPVTTPRLHQNSRQVRHHWRSRSLESSLPFSLARGTSLRPPHALGVQDRLLQWLYHINVLDLTATKLPSVKKFCHLLYIIALNSLGSKLQDIMAKTLGAFII